MTQALSLSSSWQDISPLVMEGACLAANCNPEPCPPEQWLAPLWEAFHEGETFTPLKDDVDQISQHFQNQFGQLQAVEYQWLPQSELQLAELASGFLLVWALIEANWQKQMISEATVNVISNVHMGLHFALDEAGTIEQMEAAGMTSLPDVDQSIAALEMLIPELVLAAAECYQGSKAVAVNPYKGVGRNDSCPCGSGKKFKRCCGAS